MTQLDNANGVSLKTYAYDDAFRITGISDTLDPALSWTYGYDALDRLNSATSSSVTQGWTYDANGNRLSETGGAPSTYSNSASSNRVSSIAGSLPRTYAYDAAGNTLGYASATFTYNNRGRMATAANGGVTASYTYNALGQRIRRTTSSATTLYVYDEAGHLTGEYTATGALIQETVWLGDTPVATLRPNGSGGVDLFYVHADHLNTPRLVTDTANNIRWRWESDPFGTNLPEEDPSSLGVFEYNLRFPGQQFDGVVGLHYNYFRDYDPAAGRYAESDPIGLKGGNNSYAYVNGSPSMASDPLGLFQLSVKESWSEVSSFPDMEGGGQGGLTTGTIQNVRCTCVGSGNCWNLEGCSALLMIDVKILAGMPRPKDRFMRHAEAEHVNDFMNGLGLIQEWGEIREERLRKMNFSSKLACEKHAMNAMWSTLQRAANQIARDSGERYDRGRHTWHDFYYANPPY